MAMVWELNSLFGHPSLDFSLVTSLLAPKSHSSHREQSASLIAQSSSFAYANNGFHASARWPRSWGLQPCGGAGNPHPLRSTLIDVAYENINGVTRCRDSRSPSEVPYHCHMQGEPYNTPPPPPHHKKSHTKVPKYSNTKNPTKIPTYWKMSWYPMFYTTTFLTYSCKLELSSLRSFSVMIMVDED